MANRARYNLVFTLGDVFFREQWRSLRAAQSQVGQSHGCGEGKWDREPCQTPGNEAPDALQSW